MTDARRLPPSVSRQIGCLVLIAMAIVVGLGKVLDAPSLMRQGLLLGLILVAGLFSVWLTRNVTRPLRRLRRVAQTYATSEWTPEAPQAPVREIQELAEVMTAMAHAIQAQIQALTAERNRATAILESMAEGVMALDADGRLLAINPAAADLFGAEARHAQGQLLSETVRHHELIELTHHVLAERRPATRNVTVFQPRERNLRIFAVPCDAAQPTELSVVMVIQDLSELQQYDRLRRDFVANVSHELKSPLTAIRSLTETLIDGAIDDASNNRRFVQLIDEEAARLGRLIEDLLQLAQIESQPSPPMPRAVSVKAMVDEVVPTFQPALTQRRLQLTLHLDERWRVRADPDRLKQVFINLLDNAIKYNRDGGSIEIGASPDGPQLRIAVTDTGIGIPESDLPRVFERFYRVDKARSRELGGTGLGLSIVKHIVESHGGAVSVTSRPSQGSSFSFTLPLAA